MTRQTGSAGSRVDAWTVAGLALLLLPLLTMAHELLGHALACVATGHRPTQLGAYYVECSVHTGWSGRIVAMAGTGMDVLLAGAAFVLWRRAERPLPRLAWWIVFTVKGMVAAGYWMFSGLTNLGDWSTAAVDGIGPLPWPWAWRVLMFAVGLAVYVGVTRKAIAMMASMLGGGESSWRAQRTIALTLYFVGGAAALLVSLFNPLGIAITLMSAVASSFGGTAGLFNVAYARRRTLPPTPFAVGRHAAIMVAGALVTVAFAAVLGPGITLG
ncbi:hypothetical protein ASG87_14540 [Frateuria sp. Soil773]|uniref:hypothetical protein n=1 Tax=Frateuria sp. Soil773 TaxID=1736407 RepID=UPI0006F3257D|nr:hypothetical protein [Frateuria sp. Soil773]KRE98606.1 hypothetical protein ASG87_14540 [Frateuria sp. Soil773]